MKAVYVRHHETVEKECAEAIRIEGWNARDHVRVFSSDAALMCFPYRPELVGHILYPNRGSLFDGIFLDRSLLLFRGPWAEAFLGQIHHSLCDGATMTVPYYPDPQARAKGFWSRADLEAFFGKAAEADRAGEYARFRKAGELTPTDSVLTWYFQDYAHLVVDDLLIRSALRGADPTDVRHLLSGLPLPETWPAELPFRSGEPEGTEKVAKKHRYWMGGLAVKSAVMGKIIRDRFAADDELSFLDHGGGLGLLAAELLLDPAVPVARAVNCDIDTVNLILGGRLFDFYRRRFDGCLFAHLGPSEEFPYRRPYDVVSFIGSLLYVPRNLTSSVLDRAWEALNPGGILVVHENIKTDSHKGTRDYDMMFTPEEIDRLMGRFGPVDYYAGTAATRMKPEQVGARTIFRVVQKG
ncbi:MAG: hypothetical protein JSV91_14050 [Phycisphaerales bacterium]|nr:MAG: hypothetical protein JSV91_14050 [Phycisphaerales bacterium]